MVADYFVQKRENGDYVPSSQDLTHVQETLQLLSIMTNDHRFEDAYNTSTDDRKGGPRNMCDVLDKVESRGIAKGIRPLAVPPAKGLFLSAHFPLISSKMPSRIHLKLSNETKIKKGIE